MIWFLIYLAGAALMLYAAYGEDKRLRLITTDPLAALVCAALWPLALALAIPRITRLTVTKRNGEKKVLWEKKKR